MREAANSIMGREAVCGSAASMDSMLGLVTGTPYWSKERAASGVAACSGRSNPMSRDEIIAFDRGRMEDEPSSTAPTT
ncbi:MAG: hypothetical protein BWY28_02523 [bacterium ADurb.Bin236]|nr:MAG: hypothetical protein BWY28_02523 [bacterium ADurb.Bin236]